MEIPVDPTLLVVNLDGCINPDGTQIVKGDGCMYTVAVTANEDATMVQIPVSVHCSGNVQPAFGTLSQLQDSQGHHYNASEIEQFSQVPDDLQCIVEDHAPSNNVPESQQELVAEHNTSLDINTLYYNDIYNYLTTNSIPEGATASHKLLLKKRARSYCVKDGILYYGHSKPKKVITDKEEQLKILQEFHVENVSGIHLGVKKMYSAVNGFCFWRGQYMDVANYVRQCNTCTEAGEPKLVSLQDQYLEEKDFTDNITKASLYERIGGVWERVEVAVHGPYSKTENNNEFLMTLVDPVSQWVAAQPVSKDNIPLELASFIHRTFCLFGFAKCHMRMLSEDLKENAQAIYKQEEARILQFLNKLGFLSDTSNKGSVFVFGDSDEECAWINACVKTFVNDHPTTWDLNLFEFVFELNTTERGAAQTPYHKMFGRNPFKDFVADKENADINHHNKENVSSISKRRRLQSSILQCRHCEEIFTSKISFRIHQRKHTEEARRRGTLEGEEPIKFVSSRDRKLLKRTMPLKRKERLLRQEDVKKMMISFTPNRIVRKFTIGIEKSKKSPLCETVTIQKDNSQVATLPKSRSVLVDCETPPSEICLDVPQFLGSSVESNNSSQEVLENIGEVLSNGSRDIPFDLEPSLEELKDVTKGNADTAANSHFLISDSVQALLTTNDIVPDCLLQEVVDNQVPLGNEIQSSKNAINDTHKGQGLNEHNAISSILVSDQDISSDHTSDYISHTLHIDENNSDITPCDKFDDARSCQALMNQILSDTDPKAIEDQLNSQDIIFVNQDVSNTTVQLSIPDSDVSQSGQLGAIELIYATDPVQRTSRTSLEPTLPFTKRDKESKESITSDEEEMFVCVYCDKQFEYKARLLIHIRRMHSGMLLRCSKCPYTTTNEDLLKHHQAIHKESFKCEKCNKLFTRNNNLKMHMADQHGRISPKYFACAICDVKFRSETGLKRHVQSKHEPDTTYPCDLCDYVGQCMNALSCHFERQHNKQFKCNSCDHWSATEGGLKKHMEIVHDVEKRKFKCKYCSYRSAIHRYVHQHEKMKHIPSINMHRCPICSKSFKTSVLLNHHLVCHTKRHLYSCNGCDYTSRHRQTLHYHIKKVHPGQDLKKLFTGPSKEDFQSIINSSTPETLNRKEEENSTNVPSQIISSSELLLSNDLLQESFELHTLQPMPNDICSLV